MKENQVPVLYKYTIDIKAYFKYPYNNNSILASLITQCKILFLSPFNFLYTFSLSFIFHLPILK